LTRKLLLSLVIAIGSEEFANGRDTDTPGYNNSRLRTSRSGEEPREEGIKPQGGRSGRTLRSGVGQ